MGTEHFHSSNMKSFFVSALLSAAVLLAQECPEVPPMECAEGDQVCPTGADDNGCAYPDTCMPAGEPCPVVCPRTPPMECAEGDQACPMGADTNGCSFPDVCMPAGEACPAF